MCFKGGSYVDGESENVHLPVSLWYHASCAPLDSEDKSWKELFRLQPPSQSNCAIVP